KLLALKETIKQGDEYVFVYISFDDFQTCSLCKHIHCKYIDFNDETILKILPPFHINCRCTISLFQKSALKDAFFNAIPLNHEGLNIDYFNVIPIFGKL
ncbi:MAG: hypothetical protein AB1765_07130, partial [Candidatus Hydrogenedentota bacterium]